MKELTLQELKEIEFDILKMFDSFCRDNNIKYYLAFGTLLGAIRYKKFIPWDDDVDVLVPREDYDKLIRIFRDDSKYCLFAFEKNHYFHYPFAKLCDMTTKKEQTIYKNRNVELGVEIDIFPLDLWDNDFEKAKIEAARIKKYQKWLKMTKLDKPLTTTPLKRILWQGVILFAKLIGGGFFVKRMVKESNKPSQSGSKFAGVKVWAIYGERGIIPAEVFADTTYVEFEGEMFPAPAGYDTYLTCLYGDYMPEPPVEKRKTHHSFKAYRL
ncbi:lPS biosynthesis protein [Candidatus Apopatosoma intestinale]|nr:lPS biosynthesis protein [Candidatus Apopatosoma intestinale]